MKKSNRTRLALIALLLGCWIFADAQSAVTSAGAASANSPTQPTVQDADLNQSAIVDPGLAPGDTLAVSLYDFPDMKSDVDVTIDPQGDIHLPYAGTIKIAGLSPSQAESAIANSLISKGVEKQANVTVKVLTSSTLIVYLTSEVSRPLALPLAAPAPLIYVLNQAGGFSGIEGKQIEILHRSGALPTEVNFDSQHLDPKTMNTLVHPGDIIDVMPVGVFYMLGEVGKSGIYPLTGAMSVGNGLIGLGRERNLTLLEGLTLAGGITDIAARGKALLIRKKPDGTRELIHIDIVKLEKGQIADPLLQKDDIFFVPSSYWRNATNNLLSTVVNSIYAVPAVVAVAQHP